jgi:imidazolonepropionase-like amidohydrolase
VAEQIAAKGIWVSPTVFGNLGRIISARAGGADTEETRRFAGVIESMGERLRRMRAIGCRFIASTDNGVMNAPHDGLAGSLVTWVRQFGFPAEEVVRAATLDAAQVIGVGEQTGVIEEGQQADLIAVAGDPLDAIEALQQVAFVMKGGQVYRAPERVAVAAAR